ncbi:MAG: hypothetical protein EOP83_26405 [Verrucomicrobiaceae bacterium]|nr:MAG: hypothetical protein EOP83_26405 [Verrucomicrobiaceae bacterium]
MTPIEHFPFKIRLPYDWAHKSDRTLIPWLRENVGVETDDWMLTAEHPVDENGIPSTCYIFGFKDQMKATAFRIFWA